LTGPSARSKLSAVNRRVFAVVLAALLVVALAGIALAARHAPQAAQAAAHANAAAALGQQSDEDQADDDGGVHGGTVERFHGSGCDVPSGANLSGNWTHGDYVSAWAAGGDPEAIQAAAHSACGKPLHATGSHGKQGNPPGLAKKPVVPSPAGKAGPPEQQSPSSE
jgi:hypothetical protein